MAEQSDVFDLDAAWADEQREPFTFRWAGASWTVPHLGDMDWRLVSLADEMDVDAIRKVLSDGLGEQADEFEKTTQPTPAMLRLFDAWLTHSGMKPGEAPGSDDSSPESTEEPSPRTSTASTASTSAKPSSGRRRSVSRSGS